MRSWRRAPARPGGTTAALLVVACAVLAIAACATDAERSSQRRSLASGEQVYARVCIACHAAGVDNAPKLGDRAAWKPLIEEGQDVLTAHAWVGVRAMPARGGDPGLSLEEFGRATAYMARAAGGDWKDPDASMLSQIREEERYRIESLRERADDSHDDGHGHGHDDD